MKVFTSVWNYSYGRGLCIIAANTVEEAKQALEFYHKGDYYFTWAWTTPVESETLQTNVDNPQVLYIEKYQE